MKNKLAMILFTVLLLIFIAFIPVITGKLLIVEKSRENIEQDSKTVEITIRQYNGEGMVEEIKKRIPLNLAEEIASSFQKKDSREVMELLKKHGLIPRNRSLDGMKKRAFEIVKKYNLFDKKLMKRLEFLSNHNHTRIKLFILSNMMVIFMDPVPIGSFLPMGLSLITSLLNTAGIFTGVFYPSVDLLDFIFIIPTGHPFDEWLGYEISEEWSTGEHDIGGTCSWFLTWGFVGVALYMPYVGGFLAGIFPLAIAFLTPFHFPDY